MWREGEEGVGGYYDKFHLMNMFKTVQGFLSSEENCVSTEFICIAWKCQQTSIRSSGLNHVC